MLSRDAILKELYDAPEITEAIGKMEPEHLRDDLRSEMFLAVCELKEQKLVEIYENGYLKWYMLSIMRNMIMSSTNAFHRTYRRQISLDFTGGGETSDLITAHERRHFESEQQADILPLVNPAIDALGFYEQGIFRLFNELGCSHKKVHEATQIPLRTVKWTIARIRRKLKTALRADPLPVVHRSPHGLPHPHDAPTVDVPPRQVPPAPKKAVHLRNVPTPLGVAPHLPIQHLHMAR